MQSKTSHPVDLHVPVVDRVARDAAMGELRGIGSCMRRADWLRRAETLRNEIACRAGTVENVLRWVAHNPTPYRRAQAAPLLSELSNEAFALSREYRYAVAVSAVAA